MTEPEHSKLTQQISRIGNLYIGVIYSEHGLVGCTTPWDDENEVRRRLTTITHGQQIDHYTTEDTHGYAQLIHDLHQDPGTHWDRAMQVDLDLRLYPDSHKKVVRVLRHLPVGAIISYGELAEQAGFPRASRFVGNVMASNRLPLIIPCHRVVAANGKIGNYGAGGPIAKRRYLQLEGALEHTSEVRTHP